MKQKIKLLICCLFIFSANTNADWVAGNSSVQPSSPIPACGILTATSTFSWLSFNTYNNDLHNATLSYTLPPSVDVSSGTPSLLLNNVPYPSAIFTQKTSGWDCTFPVGTTFGPGAQLTFSIAGLEIVDTPSFSNQPLINSISFVTPPTGENSLNNSSNINFNSLAIPVITVSSSASSVLYGQPVTLIASGAITYVWDSVIVQNGTPFYPALGTNVYSVVGTDAQGCTGSTSVTITANPSSTLPIEYKDFLVYKSMNSVVIDWTTLSEINNSHFDVQRSTDGNRYHNIGTVESKSIGGISSEELNYRFVDAEPVMDHNYYRLQQVDVDGKKSYTPGIDIIFTEKHQAYTIYPNPAGDIVNMDLDIEYDKDILIKLIDLCGRELKILRGIAENGITHLSLPMDDIAPGFYGLQIFENNRFTRLLKVRKK